MNVWPDIAVPSSMSGGIFDPLDEANMETGDDAARPRFSVPRQQPMRLEWAAMSYADFDALVAFHANQRSTPFLWVRPRTGVQWEARFVSNAITHSESRDTPGRLAVQCTIQPIRRVE